MAGGAVIVREATDADLRPLHDLAVKVWAQLGIPYETSLDRFRALKRHSRILVLWHEDKLLASLIAHPIETDRGPGFEIKAFVVDQDQPDRLKLLDALSLYAMNIGLSEGRGIVVSRRDRRIRGIVYGRDQLGMDATQGDDAYIHQVGHAKDMMARILERHPEWQLP
jgi:hypothetical protein